MNKKDILTVAGGVGVFGGILWIVNRCIKADERVRIAEAEAMVLEEENRKKELEIEAAKVANTKAEEERRWETLSDEARKEIFLEKERNLHERAIKTIDNSARKLDIEYAKAKSREEFSALETELKNKIVEDAKADIVKDCKSVFSDWKSSVESSIEWKIEDIRKDMDRLKDDVNDNTKSLTKRIDKLVDRTSSNQTATPTTIINNKNE